MIAAAPLTELIAADPLGPAKAAIRATFAGLLPGVTVVSHPGKLDISEVFEKAVVATPGIAVGWSRVRQLRIIDGAYHLVVDFTAYVVVEDAAIDNRRVDREVLGLAIGSRVVAILQDPDTHTWGLGRMLPPEAEPRPELRPMFTVRDAAKGAAYYAVTWTQTVIDQGTSLFAGSSPTVTPAGADAFDIEGEGDILPELIALLGIEEVSGG